jgi:hypothetical protein
MKGRTTPIILNYNIRKLNLATWQLANDWYLVTTMFSLKITPNAIKAQISETGQAKVTARNANVANREEELRIRIAEYD